MKTLFFSFFALLLAGCNRPEATPELRDPIYQDIQAELNATQSKIADTESQLEGYRAQLDKVVPQNGQYKYFEKHVFETQKFVEKFKQQKKFWTVRLESRRNVVRRSYLKGFKSGKPWDPTKEFEAYQAEKRLRQARAEWDVQQRRETFLKDQKASRAPAAGGGEGAEAPSKGGGEE